LGNLIFHNYPDCTGSVCHRFKSFKASLVKVFREQRAQSLTLERVVEFANGEQSSEPFSPSEVSAAITQMTDANQIMVADGMVFLI
jgi:DNA replication licensing factor MCM3